MEEPNNDIDSETLQAQIDLSMAYAQNLISSWLPTSGPMTQPSSRAAEAELELQALLRRPPRYVPFLLQLRSHETSIRAVLCFFFPLFFLGIRLGVGAPLPETFAPAQTRLVQKLEGGKRRARELENGARSAVTANKDEQEEEKDNAEESRVAEIAIRKRQRVDPFESGGKKKKRKVVVVGSVGTVETAHAKDDDVEMKEASQSRSMATNDAMTRPGPRKKKKKKRMPESLGAQGLVARGGPSGDTQSARLDADITPYAESSDRSSLFEEWAGIAQDQQGSRCGTPSSYSGKCFI